MTLKQQPNGEEEKNPKMKRKAKPLICFGLSYVVFLSSAWKKKKKKRQVHTEL